MTQIYETDVLVSGYGIIPKLVMKDKDLTIEAKAIYAYIAPTSLPMQGQG